MITSRLNDTLDPVPVSAETSWEHAIDNPGGGGKTTVGGVPLAANEIIIYVGGKELGRDASGREVAGFGGPFIPSVKSNLNLNSLTPDQLARIQDYQLLLRSRGEHSSLSGSRTEFGIFGGTITFDTSTNWHFGGAAGLDADEQSFVSIAAHELIHVFGFGADYFTGQPAAARFETPWHAYANGNQFRGPAATAAYDGSGSPPISSNHWDQSLTDNGRTPLLVPAIDTGENVLMTGLDLAILDDLGYDVLRSSINVNASHHYPDDGTYQPTIILKGSVSGETRTPLANPVVVTNVNPTLPVMEDKVVVVNTPLTISEIAEISDPGFASSTSDPATTETFTYSIDWSDGSDVETGDARITQAGNATRPTLATFGGTHTYTKTGNYSVRVTVKDDDEGTATRAFSVTVTPPPKLELVLSKSSVGENEGDKPAELDYQTHWSSIRSSINGLVGLDRRWGGIASIERRDSCWRDLSESSSQSR